jgi:uncharacterized protein (DUF433 family)
MMNDAEHLPIPHIVRTPEHSDGEPSIAGHGVTVRQIARAHVGLGAGIDELVETFRLSRAQVYAALAYYYDHLGEFDEGHQGEEGPLPLQDREMTVTEIAAMYGVTPQAVREAALRGWIRARKSGATWLIQRRDAERRWGKSSS